MPVDGLDICVECAIPDVERLNYRAPLKSVLCVAYAFGRSIDKWFLSEAFSGNVCEKAVQGIVLILILAHTWYSKLTFVNKDPYICCFISVRGNPVLIYGLVQI